MKKTTKFLLTIQLLTIAFKLLAADTTRVNNQFVWLPERHLIPVFTADSRANRLGFQRNFDQQNYTISMGGIFPVLEMRRKVKVAQVSMAGSTYLTLDKNNQSGSVLNTDFFGELFLDIRLKKNYFLRLGTGHSSQHLSDDAIVGGLPFKNYAKDYHQVFVIRKTKRLLAYAGTSFFYNFKTLTDISNKFQLQAGFEHNLIKTNKQQHIYYAGDLKLRQELDFASILNIQLGYKIQRKSGKTIRIASNYTHGKDERGYFMNQNRNFAQLGLYFDF